MFHVFIESGMFTMAGEGPIPLSWSEVYHFGITTGLVTETWEYRTLHKMSRSFIVEMRKGASPFALAPADQTDDWEEEAP